MKTLTAFLAIFAISISVAAAQDVTGFRRPEESRGPSTSRAGRISIQTLPRSSVASSSDGAKYGTQMINPYAPASYGVGEKYLSAPSTREDLKNESAQAAHRDAGRDQALHV